MFKRLLTWLGLYNGLESVLGKFEGMIRDLENHIVHADRTADEAAEAIQYYMGQQAQAQAEAKKAERVAANIRALVTTAHA